MKNWLRSLNWTEAGEHDGAGIVCMLLQEKCTIFQRSYKLFPPVRLFHTYFERLAIAFRLHKKFGVDDMHKQIKTRTIEWQEEHPY